MTAFGDHLRENVGILAAAEKRCLVWMAHRLPLWVNSDHLTALGFLGMLAAAVGFVAAGWSRLGLVVAVGGLAVNWFGDSLDGTLARVRGKLRPRYGFYIDHVIDVIGAVALLLGMGLSGRMTPLVAGALLLVYLMLNAEIFLATHSLGVFRMSYWRLGPTELRILLAIGILRAYFRPEVTLAGHGYLLFDVGGVAAALALAVTLAVSVIRNSRALSRAEPVA
jgi:phosphatidylglycerophosphate synthase